MTTVTSPLPVGVSDAGLALESSAWRSLPAVMVHFDDRLVWSFNPSRDGTRTRGGIALAWPHAMDPFLDGVTQVRLSTPDDEVLYDAEHRFGAGSGRLAFADQDGNPYTVDKAGHLSRAFEMITPELRHEIMLGTQAVLDVLREECHVDAWLGYGALLGAVREGGMIGHDSDTDLCYLSKHVNPTDVVRESHQMERVLKAGGMNVLRMSSADLKVIWPLTDGRNCHIDIFGSFHTGDFYYAMAEHGDVLDRSALVPLSTVTLDGYEFPAPADPEALVAYYYGPSWRVPDPAFMPHIDPLVMKRLDGWFRGFRSRMGDWTGTLRGTAGKKSPVPRDGSAFAAWVHEQIAPDAGVLDLGAGNGRDGVWFAGQGHPVRSSDYSRRSAVETRALRAAHGVKGIAVRQVILNETRHVFHLIGELGRAPHHLYLRQVVGCLDAAARENLFRIGAATLRGQDSSGAPYSMWLEFSATAPGAPRPAPVGLVERLDPGVLALEITASGGTVEHLEIAPGRDMFDNQDPAVARIRATWPTPSQQKEAL